MLTSKFLSRLELFTPSIETSAPLLNIAFLTRKITLKSCTSISTKTKTQNFVTCIFTYVSEKPSSQISKNWFISHQHISISFFLVNTKNYSKHQTVQKLKYVENFQKLKFETLNFYENESNAPNRSACILHIVTTILLHYPKKKSAKSYLSRKLKNQKKP